MTAFEPLAGALDDDPRRLPILAALAAFPLARRRRREARIRADGRLSLEWASDPQISPDGDGRLRASLLRREDRRAPQHDLARRTATAANHRPLAGGARQPGEPRWSPDGNDSLSSRPMRTARRSTCTGSPKASARA
jgi:hypothetical protein